MSLWLLILLPTVCGIIAYFIRSDLLRRILWSLTAVVHFAFSTLLGLVAPPVSFSNEWIGIDPLSRLFLPLTSMLFLASTVYGIGFLRRESTTAHPDAKEAHSIFPARPEAVFTGCMLLFLASMTAVILSRRFGFQWVSIEATTLASTPLIYYHRDRPSLEAAWKYILLCSLGIALALLGVFCLALASAGVSDQLTVDSLLAHAKNLNPHWLKLSYVFILVGYGTKMGLAPMHAWLPDAHSEAPSPVSALLSGALLNCAFIGIMRLQQVCAAAGIPGFGQNLLVLFGLISMGVAAVFILKQGDYKRLLAYSSIEHMGIIALGVGLAGSGSFGSLLHAINHSMVKAMLFMSAGNILWVYRSKRVAEVTGVGRLMPIGGVLWLGGFLAITGSPPFGTFISEFTILQTALDQGRWGVASLYLIFLSLVFIGLAGAFLKMTLGAPPDPKRAPVRIDAMCIVPPLIFGTMALILGLFIPESLDNLLSQAASLIGGTGL